jgi:hypothetical protein
VADRPLQQPLLCCLDRRLDRHAIGRHLRTDPAGLLRDCAAIAVRSGLLPLGRLVGLYHRRIAQAVTQQAFNVVGLPTHDAPQRKYCNFVIKTERQYVVVRAKATQRVVVSRDRESERASVFEYKHRDVLVRQSTLKFFDLIASRKPACSSHTRSNTHTLKHTHSLTAVIVGTVFLHGTYLPRYRIGAEQGRIQRGLDPQHVLQLGQAGPAASVCHGLWRIKVYASVSTPLRSNLLPCN